MAKKTTEKLTDTVETLRPYVDRALKDEDFRNDLQDALEAARGLYGNLQKRNGITAGATKLATDKDTQESLRRLVDDLQSAGDRLKGKKDSHKARNTLLLAGVIVGALYNPWTGEQTRKWIMDKVAGGDDLQPLDTYEPVSTPAPAEPATADRTTSIETSAETSGTSSSSSAES
jgi:hypothetical protein